MNRGIRRALVAALVGAVAVGALHMVITGTGHADTRGGDQCVWLDEFNDTIHQLGSNRAVWDIVEPAELPDPRYAAYTEFGHGTVKVRADQRCEDVSDIVRHEWMHIQQVRMHGGGSEIRQAYGDRVEIVADCGSWLLGSDYTPYRDKARADTGTACTPQDISDARELIDHPSFADEVRGQR